MTRWASAPAKPSALSIGTTLRRPSVIWGIALAALVGAVLLRWALDPVMGDTLPLVTLFGAVAVAVWVGGYQPAIVVVILGYLACEWLFIEPRGELTFDVTILVGLVAYLFTCSLIVGIGEAMRRAQARAGERGELLRVTLGSIGDAVITTDDEGRVTYLNAVAESLCGWRHEEASGRPLDEVFRIVDEQSRKPLESPATRAIREGVIVGLANHAVLVARDGVEHPIDDSAAPIRDEQGRISGCVLIFRDVSHRRRGEKAEAARLLDARRLASIVESSDDAIIGKSLDGIIQSWNAGAERLFGHTAEQAIGRHISLVIPPERLTEEDDILANLRAGRRVDHFETERLRRDGRLVPVSLSISPIKDDEGRVVGASKVARDITERKRAEAERRRLEDDLRKLAADLSEADHRKNEFLATLSHELRNPLAPLSHTLEILKRGGGDEATLRRSFEIMERQLGHLVRLVDDLLDLNRITHNRIELRKERVELRSVIDQALHTIRPLVESARHEMTVVWSPEPLFLDADPVRLSQVFGNLLHNACKYTSPGGRIRVTSKRQGSEAVVTIEDDGMGIPPDQLDSIFEMFTQVERSLDRSQGGLGIGLTLVKRLVELHGGSVAAKSAGEGLGTELVVRLPLAAAVQDRSPATTPMAEPDRSRSRRVLIVDDNEDAASSLAALLQITGHEAYTVHDGSAALEAARAHPPDVMLLDIGLPTIDGYELCRRVREEPWGKAMKLIALTGWGQEDDRRRSLEAGFDSHLVKPVDYAELLALLD